MASGYLHITKEDIFADENGVIYWKNGAKILGEIVSCIDSNEDVHYYLKSTNIKKAILIDAFVQVGVNDYFLYSDSVNFINVQIDSEDYSSIGGGAGIAITFLLPEGKYYTIHEIDGSGNLAIFDPAGDGGQINGDPFPDTTDASAGDVLSLDSDKKPVWNPIPEVKKYYEHHLTLKITGEQYIYLTIISTSNTAFNATSLKNYVSNFNAVACSGYFTSTLGNKGVIMNIFNTASNKCGREMIKMYQDSDKTISITRDTTQAEAWTNYTITDDIKEI